MTLDEAGEIENGRDPRREKSWKEMVEIIRDSDGEEVRVTSVEDTYVTELDVGIVDPLKTYGFTEHPGYLNVRMEMDDDPKIRYEILSHVNKDRRGLHEDDYYYTKLSVFKIFYDDEWDVKDEKWEKIVDIEPV